MSSTILEELSNRKLVGILTLLLLAQIASFYIGAFLTPPPSSFEQFTSVHCFRKNRHQLAIPRDHKINGDYVGKNCDTSTLGISKEKKKEFEETTFAVQLPFPRENLDLAYSRWMQTLLVILTPEFQYEPLLVSPSMMMEGARSHSGRKLDYQFPVLIDIDLAVKYRDDHDWTIYSQRRSLKRTVHCQTSDPKHGHKFDCDTIQLFELQSLHYEYYLINFEIRGDKTVNNSIHFPGRLSDIPGVAIHHNGGFTQIWLAFKSIFFVMTLATLVWYIKRLNRLPRKTILIERLLIGLGVALTQLNIPIEILTLQFEVTFMTFLNDLRQGIFYCALLSFWIIFVREHLLDGSRKNSQLVNYIKELLAICVASLALLVFDLSERGIQALDPFITVWESRPNLANFSITVAICASIAYLCLLAYYICLAYRAISGKKTLLPEMPTLKRLKYQGLIYRFKFLLCATIVCALSTFAFYALSLRDDSFYDDDTLGSSVTIEWKSAMLITVCAMWNLYVIVLVIFYAPSHKADLSDQIEFECLTSEQEEVYEGGMKEFQEFSNKSSID